MVTFERCDPNEKGLKCKSTDEIDNYLSYSYILLVENSELFAHHLPSSSPEMFQKETKISWYAVTTSIR